MQVVIIGSGNLAWVLAKSLVLVKYHIQQVYSRNLSDAVLLTKEVGGEAVDNIKAIQKDADKEPAPMACISSAARPPAR